MKDIFQIAGQVAGLGGIAIVVFLAIAKAIVGKTREVNQGQSFALLNRILILAGIITVLGMISWLISLAITGDTSVRLRKLDVDEADTRYKVLADSIQVEFARAKVERAAHTERLDILARRFHAVYGDDAKLKLSINDPDLKDAADKIDRSIVAFTKEFGEPRTTEDRLAINAAKTFVRETRRNFEEISVANTIMGDVSLAHGPVDAPLTVVVFVDASCPFCAKLWDRAIPGLLEKYAGKLRVSVRHFPLPFDDLADDAAHAAFAAAQQGRYWEFMNELLSNGSVRNEGQLATAAQNVALDLARFERDRHSAAAASFLDRELAFARQIGIHGTPTIYLHNTKISGSQPIEAFQQIIETLLSHKSEVSRYEGYTPPNKPIGPSTLISRFLNDDCFGSCSMTRSISFSAT